uniref:Uncharacterized protein n=1 Tax=Caenorhabditis japonica TaxID=281687 RepID=A0A8R1EVV8_CAEJA
MASNRKSEFVSRSSLFASPGQCAVPKKKVARGGNLPVFALHDNSEVMEMSRAAAAAAPITKQSALILPEDDVEPMDVDATLMPSPQKASDKEEVDEEREVASGNTACTKMATPRRKSMPTPGNDLFHQ